MEALSQYAEYLYSAPSAQLAFEVSVVVFLIWMLKRGPGHDGRKLSEREKAQLLADFEPEPLCGEIPADHYALNPRIVSGRVGKHVTINEKPLLNLATHNYLGFADRPDSTEKAVKALRNYGVGSCGPRGFYGTADVHLELESRLAKFMNVEEACLYSYGFSAISSGIPSYSKSHDVIFADEEVNFAIQQGIVASRSTVYFFKHNDPEDLERLLKAQDERDRKNPRKAKSIRRFLILEGIYMNTGTLVNLPEMVKLRAKYMCRLFIDETFSFGVLGEHGRGVREHFNIPNKEIDLMSSSLEHAISSYGGFLCGSHFLMEHQRLCGLAYCFSASLPPLQAVVTLSHLDIMTEKPETFVTLRENCGKFHELLAAIEGVKISSDRLSPLKHLSLADISDVNDAQKRIDKVVKFAEENGVAVTQARYLSEKERMEHPPTIRITVSSLLTDDDMTKAAQVIRTAFQSVL